MKDLKHLIFFENLLQDAQNELVTQAIEEGNVALGYNCFYIPEVLLNLKGCFSTRLRAPRCTSTDVATYYMTGRTCPYVRSILERAIEGGYNYLGALFGAWVDALRGGRHHLRVVVILSVEVVDELAAVGLFEEVRHALGYHGHRLCLGE